MDTYYDLGAHTRKISTTSPDAQIWFDRGLNWIYGFNHEEAVLCFHRALEHDSTCAMAHWGVIYATGPNYNQPWPDIPFRQKRRAVATIAKHLDLCQPLLAQLPSVERAFIETVTARQIAAAEIEDFDPQTQAYASQMRALHAQYPDDLDVAALTAEALMCRSPWQQWDTRTGEQQEGSSALEAQNLLETAFDGSQSAAAMAHPGLLHMYIHLMEMSQTPEKALPMGDALVDLMPDAGHLQHMGTHVDVLCGRYEQVVTRNHKAWEADQKFLSQNGPMTFYTIYMCHNLHFKLYGAMFLGRLTPALEAASALEGLLTPDVVEPSADWMESYVPMRQHALIRFGKWDDIIAQDLPENAELFSFTTAVMLYAKTVACAATSRIEQAETHKTAFYAAKAAVPDERMLFNNTCSDILDIAAHMLEGELSYRKADYDIAFEHLRKAIALDDALPYEEPWGWMQPVRHALGALLLEQGHVSEAETVYRADLGLDPDLPRACQNPNNIWSLHGLHECLTRREATAEAAALKPKLDAAQAKAETPIKASCACRLSH